MPTPSPNEPPNPPSPPSISSSSCPDDVQVSTTRQSWRHPPSRSHNVDMNLESTAESYVAGTSSHPATHESGAIDDIESTGADRIVVVDEPTSVEPSSRGTTTSPAPRSTATARTSPLPAPIDDEATKIIDSVSDATNTPVSRGHSVVTRRRTVTDIAHRETLEPNMRNRPNSPTHSRFDESLPTLPISPGFPGLRFKTVSVSPSSFLRRGSKYHGTQQSERQVYDVQVEIKHVDMRESFLCGYLRIQGLTADHPTLTTYFEGEIIGDRYGFLTKHDDWGANTKIDLNHWSKFSAFRPYQKHARKGPINITDAAQRENIFMRWKEHFLVPDHRVRTISGASFEGFYYICFNQVKGEVSGIYFHSKSEKFQQLELKHVPDRGCLSAMEFR